MKCTDGSVQFGPRSCYIHIESLPLLLRSPSPLPQPHSHFIWITQIYSAPPGWKTRSVSRTLTLACGCTSPWQRNPESCYTRGKCLCVFFPAFINARGRESALALACRWGRRNRTSRFCHSGARSCYSRSAYQYSTCQLEKQWPGMYFPGHLVESSGQICPQSHRR